MSDATPATDVDMLCEVRALAVTVREMHGLIRENAIKDEEYRIGNDLRITVLSNKVDVLKANWRTDLDIAINATLLLAVVLLLISVLGVFVLLAMRFWPYIVETIFGVLYVYGNARLI